MHIAFERVRCKTSPAIEGRDFSSVSPEMSTYFYNSP